MNALNISHLASFKRVRKINFNMTSKSGEILFLHSNSTEHVLNMKIFVVKCEYEIACDNSEIYSIEYEERKKNHCKNVVLTNEKKYVPSKYLFGLDWCGFHGRSIFITIFRVNS